jgi:ribosomal protein S18 acetylase RimI-like enzyme
MGTSTSISRLRVYYARNGFWSTVCRAGLAAKRALFSNRSVLFYCDLSTQIAPVADLPGFLKVERKQSATELSPEDLQAMTSFWNPNLAGRNIKERFEKGASLWLIRSDGKLAGYGWTLRGRTIEPHYFPIGQEDVHLFDFHVFSQYRGRGLNPYLVTKILCNLATERAGRAFIEAAEWNLPQLSSLKKTPFHRLGYASKLAFFGRTIAYWAENKTR